MNFIYKIKHSELSPRQFYGLSAIIIAVFAAIPLFVSFPYRINIFLAWEGAYRISLGQIPFKDFGMPLGYGFWLIPALFFKIFGPYLFTLVKAQAFINIIAGLTFLNILRILKIQPAITFFSVLLFCLSYSFVNFWPWYNHMVFVYQLLSINFLLLTFFSTPWNYKNYVYIFLSSLFIFLSFFTKQDGGALAFLVNFFILLYLSYTSRNYKIFAWYFTFLLAIAALFILPVLSNFLYWFNYGQEPHSSRIQAMDILNNIFFKSEWIKFYVLMFALILLARLEDFKTLFTNKEQFTFSLLVLGILVQAMIVQTTSYIPHNVNVYFHSFSFAFILALLSFKVPFHKTVVALLLVVLISFWWSSDYWKYGNRIITKVFPQSLVQNDSSSVSINTWIMREDTVKTSRGDWISYDSKAFENITMPPSTVEGIDYIKNLEIVKSNKNLKVLNMSELTPLAYELGYKLETGRQIPLWHHQNVAIFDKQIKAYCEKIEADYYDLVLFEHINYLNNFYPEDVRKCLKANYNLINKFLAPREIQNSYVEVYVRKSSR